MAPHTIPNQPEVESDEDIDSLMEQAQRGRYVPEYDPTQEDDEDA